MRPPPPLRLACRDLPAWRALRACIAGLSTAVAATWLPAWLGWLSGWTLLLPALCAGVAVAIWVGRPDARAHGVLTWSGQTWNWQPRGDAQASALLTVDIAIDLQSLVLLRLQAQAESRSCVPGWICLQRADRPDDWSLSCLTLRTWRLAAAATDIEGTA